MADAMRPAAEQHQGVGREVHHGRQRRQALRQADGALRTLYAGWAQRLTRILAQQEAAIEFEMDDLPTDVADRAREAAANLQAEITAHLDDGGRGEKLREGVSIVILGAPNAGKSSLLNALAGRDAALVSPQPGTTRDIVECRLELAGVPVVLADTAGLRTTTDPIEQEGMRRASQRGREADIILAAFAADQDPDAETLAAIAHTDSCILIATKCDLGPPPAIPGAADLLPTSIRGDPGIDGLRAALAEAVARKAGLGEAPALTRARHRAGLAEAAAQLDTARQARLPELAAEGYRAALGALGRVTGRVGVEQVLDAVFRDFCIGK